jgi:hypothetical protein
VVIETSRRVAAALPLLLSRVLLLVLALLVPAAARAQDAGTIRGVVVARDGDVPLSYGVIAIPALAVERFTDAAGRFTLRDVPAGRHVLRVKRLGFQPLDTTVIVAAGATAEVRLGLARVPQRLSTVYVRADRDCRQPGPPSRATSPAFADLFEQLAQNAERLRLLSDGYPFRYAVERTYSRRLRDGAVIREGADTSVVASSGPGRWRYQPGQVVTRERNARAGGAGWVINIPTLLDFADAAFQNSHCFDFATVEEVEGQPLLRVDFRPARSIRDPDVTGSFYLDTATYQIRRSTFRLSRVPSQVRGVTGSLVTTIFREVVPGVPLVSEVFGENALQPPRGRFLRPPVATLEQHRLLCVHFLGERPGGESGADDPLRCGP